ncbi:MAG: hypothetical protein Q4D80_03485 [Pseudomonadota bacterium]|nr:hypothetical protein [Pseudomonadota bacterium]
MAETKKNCPCPENDTDLFDFDDLLGRGVKSNKTSTDKENDYHSVEDKGDFL